MDSQSEQPTISYPDTISSFEQIIDSCYNPISTEQIVCIEMNNNNHIYIHYENSWKIKDLIKHVINHKEFKKLYPQRQWQLNSSSLLTLFDLHLTMFRNLKQETETKIDFDIELGDLHEKGLLKNHKYPFFIFKDNRNNGNLITSYEEKLESLKTITENNFETFTMYNNFLPRAGVLNVLNSHPELADYYQSRKEGINSLSRFNINPLITDKKNLDWFIYDDESMNFLASLETKHFSIESNIKFIYDDSSFKVLFEDKYPKADFTSDDVEEIFVNITYINPTSEKTDDQLTKKIKLNLQTTGRQLLELMNKKLKMVGITFDIEKKILKVKSLNDYIIDLDVPLIRFAYINACITKKEDADYFIIDNPLLILKHENVSEKQMRLSDPLEDERDMDEIFVSERKKTVFRKEGLLDINSPSFQNDENIQKLFTIASFKPDNNKKIQKQKKIQRSYEHNDCDELETFTKNIIKDINDSTKVTIEETTRLVNDVNGSVMMNDDLNESWNISAINLNQSNTLHMYHPLPRQNMLRDTMIRGSKGIITNDFLSSMNTSSFFNGNTTFSARKKGEVKKTPNIFLEMNKEPCDTLTMIQDKNDAIELADIQRPFSIIFRSAYLNKTYSSFPFDKKNKTSVLIFKFQIFCGTEPFSKPKHIKWISSNSDFSPCFNKRIYFDIDYSNLPMFASLIIKLNLNVYEKNNSLKSNKTVAWCNFRLFDHKDALMTGIHKLCLLEKSFSDDSHFCYIDSVEENPSSVFFEIDSFISPVVNRIYKLENFDYNIDSLMISDTDMEKIKDITQKNPFDELNNYDKEVLWANRFKLSQEPTILPKLLLCIDYTNPTHASEVEKILFLAKKLTPIQSMELLTGKYLHKSIRKFAVTCLSDSTPQEIENYLIQLVQGLKYEMTHDNDLAKYLLNMAINYPLTIGHSLFWSLRAEMYNPNVQQRFGLYLEVFLTKIGEKLCKIFSDEAWFVSELLKVADIPKKQKKDDKLLSFKAGLKNIQNLMESKNITEVSLPLNFKYRIKGFRVDKCKPMKSKKKPLWLVMENADPYGEDIVMLFKSGDDLRMDIVTLQLFKIMKTLWFKNHLKLKMSIYSVVSTGLYQGMIEIVKNSETLAFIHKNEGGALQSLSKVSLKKWLEKNSPYLEDEYCSNFMLSNVAYCAATFVLGIGDRHSDNIMIKKNGELFHIDFGHFLGHFKYKYGFKRERAPFVFTKQFQNVLGGEKDELYLEFKNKFWEAYQILRKNAIVLITLLRILLCSGVPELNEKSIQFLDKTLCLDNNEEQAQEYLDKQLTSSLNSWSVDFNFLIHIIANK